MRPKSFWLSCLLLGCVLGRVFAAPQAATTKAPGSHSHTSATPNPKPKASWTEYYSKAYGISKQQFEEMGLPNLTPDQVVTLLAWVAQAKADATETAKKLSHTISCGRTSGNLDSAAYENVRLFIETVSDNPAEFVSGFRQRLRGISDVELVYTRGEADLIVDILAYQQYSKARTPLGYTASVVALDPCQSHLFGSTTDLSVERDHFMHTAADISELVESTVTQLDANDIESMRKDNAELRRVFQGLETKPH